MVVLGIVLYGVCGHKKSAWYDTKDKALPKRLAAMACPECRGDKFGVDSLCGSIPAPSNPVLPPERAEEIAAGFRERHCARPKGLEGWKGFRKELISSFSEREVRNFWTNLKEGRRNVPPEALEAWSRCGGAIHAHR